jgi:hypothetical protein
MIYINAFPLWRPETFQPWRTKPVLICDGGESVWGVLYDPVSKTFRDLAFNGNA